MATVLNLEPGTDLVETVTADPSLVLLDRERFDAFYERMKAETDRLVPDVSTAKGRDEIRSVARRVVTAKTTIDKARLQLTKDWRDKVEQANAAGKVITQRLDALADEVRRPLTEWEDAEKARVADCEAVIDGLRSAAIVTDQDTSATVKARGGEVWAIVIDRDRFDEHYEAATLAKEQAIATLRAAMTRLKKAEDDAAELERLRAAEAERLERERAAAEEREAVERQEREARERQERADCEAREAEDRRIAAEQAESDRIAAAERAAEERARNEERQRHERELAAERDRAEAAERAVQAERDRAAAAERARQAEEDRLAAEQREREANKQHRTSVKRAAKQAIMTAGVTEEAAQKIVLMIVAGEVPHVRLEF